MLGKRSRVLPIALPTLLLVRIYGITLGQPGEVRSVHGELKICVNLFAQYARQGCDLVLIRTDVARLVLFVEVGDIGIAYLHRRSNHIIQVGNDEQRISEGSQPLLVFRPQDITLTGSYFFE